MILYCLPYGAVTVKKERLKLVLCQIFEITCPLQEPNKESLLNHAPQFIPNILALSQFHVFGLVASKSDL